MILNYSNHPSHLWNEDQIKAAEAYGEIVDMPFPSVPADLDEEGINKMADRDYTSIIKSHPDCVLCQGEFTLAYALIKMLRESGIRVVAACSERITRVEGDVKISEFKFVRFREYI